MDAEFKKKRVAYVVAPSGQAGGGMGRVKDYIIAGGNDVGGQIVFEPLITRDNRGFGASLRLTAIAVLRIWMAQFTGRLALAHVNLGDKASAVRKGLVALLARGGGATVVVHLHAVQLMQAYARGGTVRRWLIGLPFRAASTNIVLGEIWRRWLVDELGVKPSRVDVLANGVPVLPFKERDHVTPREEVRLLFLGNLLERKGVADLIEALSLLPADLPKWTMIMAGGGDIERYSNLAAARGLSERIVFKGWVDQAGAGELLSLADALVLPSYDEGLPLVILEALGVGTPVVCTPVGAIPEFLSDGQTALFTPPGNVPQLAKVLALIIEDGALRQSLSDAGRISYQKTFSLDVFLQSLFELYKTKTGVQVIEGL